MLYSKSLCLLLSLISIDAGLSKGNVRMHVTTKKFCNLGLVDANGNPAPCGTSQAEGTYGLTLPGMEDGVQTTKEDVIIAKDGQVSVQATPALPYTFLMSVNSPSYSGVEKLYNHQSFVVAESVPEVSEASTLGATLADDGWLEQVSDDVSLNKWLLYGPQGVDSTNGANYTALYQTGVIPDAWVLYTDRTNENPVKLIAVNTFLGERVFQETTFENVESLEDDATVSEAMQAVYSTYQVDGGRRLASEASALEAPHVDADMIDAPFVSEKTRLFFENDGDFDWMSKRRLRSSTGFKGISYFTIEKGSAADIYFHAAGQRALADLVKFEYPKGCVAAAGKREQKYCLFVSADVSADPSITLQAGMTFIDIKDGAKSAHLALAVTLKKDKSVVSLSIDAGGCAVVFQYGQTDSTHLAISVCMTSKDPAKKKADGTIEGEVAITVNFMVHINHIGDLIDWDINAKVNCTAAPNNDITAFGVIGTSASAKVAYASVSLDVKANTLEHAYNKWHFISGVDFHAWAGVWKFKKHWDYRWQLYEAGPVTI
ncbi:hypothetical protein FOL47_004885 [Perkinsus chesapeaki]|uniref:Uncharacterized protein n=1 Tax=Perkinsus chesapeaki TaxID=330153 RepID=A0A7J6M057_PERCH|nr:hypothetical protein FOL47_004885 [Perkinsus chesapeaki]